MGDVQGASKFLQKNDRFARIRDLQEQGKLTPDNFDKQVAGLYPELSGKDLQAFQKSAKQTFIEDPGWFRSKKLIPQEPKVQVQQPNAASATQQSAVPAQQPQGQIMVSPSTGRRFMKNPDGSMTEIK